MPSSNINIDDLSDAIMEQLTEYSDLATDDMKAAVKDAANVVKKRINSSAPVRTGKYAKSWRTKTTKENDHELEVTVYSPTRYRLAHLLENGHAKRGGGRVAAQPHIKPAEQAGIEKLEEDIERALKG